jgi:hypothetical protein
MARWFRQIFENAKTHLYPLTLESRLRRNWHARGFRKHPGVEDAGGPPDWPYHETPSSSLCLGGMGMKGETWEHFHLPGLDLAFLAREVESYLIHLEQLGPRLELNRRYYKLHGALHCVCLLPSHRDRLLGQMRDRLPVANAIAAAEAVQFNQAMDSANRHPLIDIKQRLPQPRLVQA